MIAFVEGKIAEKFVGSVVVDVSGVGYEVQVTMGDYDQAILGDQKKYYTYHHVRSRVTPVFGC